MMGATHIASGFAAASFSLTFTNGNPEVAIGLVLGSILPDIDTYKSRFSVPILSHILNLTLGHRGFTHTLGFAALLAAGISFVSPALAMAVGLGVLLHIALDMIAYADAGIPLTTGNGVRLFSPFSAQKLGVRLVKMESFIEKLVLLPLLYLTATLGIVLFMQ